jgi:5'-nucleotidase
MSLETDTAHHLSYSNEVDFSASAYFTAYFARLLLERQLPQDVDVLKVDVPAMATPDTEWVITRLARKRYFEATAPQRGSWSEPGRPGYRRSDELENFDRESDVFAVLSRRLVSVTPVSLDMTSRVDLSAFHRLLR